MKRSLKRSVTGIGTALLTMTVAAVASAAVGAATNAAPTAADDIRDIRPLILIPPWWYWLAAAVAATLLLGLVAAAVHYFRRRSQRALTPLERAQKALTRAEELARAGQCRPWAELVAAAIRDALAARLELESCPQTTNELSTIDWTSAPRGATVDGPGLIALLSTCDLTRFALARLDANALLMSTDAARAWVERLFALEPAPAPEATPSATKNPSTPASDAA